MDTTQNQRYLRYYSYAKELKKLYEQPVARTSTALILTLATATFFGLAAIRPTLATVSQLMREIEDKKEIEKKLSQKISTLSSVQEEYFQIEDKLDLLDNAIPQTQQLRLLLMQIEYLAYLNHTPIASMRSQALTIYSSDPSVPAPKVDPFPSYTINFNVTAPSNQSFRPLLVALDNLDRIARIESVSFGQPKTEADPYQMTVTFRTYWAPPIIKPTPKPSDQSPASTEGDPD